MTHPAITWLIPPTLYAVVGIECNVYFEGVFSSIYPFDAFSLNVTTTIPADTSQQQDERWTFTPSAAHVGDWTLRFVAVIANTPQADASAILRVRAATLPAPVTRRLLVIGDSTTANGEVLAELVNLSEGTGLTLATAGTKTATWLDAKGTARTVLHEAVSGKSIAWHYGDVNSSFVFGGVFDFGRYLSTRNVTLAAGDWVLVNLGINDVFGFTDDAACLTAIALMVTRLSALIASVKAAVPGIRIGLCLTIPPSHSQDAFAANYGSGQTRARYKRNRDTWVNTMLATWGGQAAQGVYLVPIHAALDTRHNMQTTQPVAVNARNSAVMVARQSNGVHPAQSGYEQLADALFAFLLGNEG